MSKKQAEDRICEFCGRTWSKHTFADFLFCLYGGTELKDGGLFTHETAEGVVDRIFNKLCGPEEGK